MKTFTMVIIMDAEDEDDFVDEVMKLKPGELKAHVEEVEE